jgi:hypothetical protein
MQREVNRSKEMMSWILWPTGRSSWLVHDFVFPDAGNPGGFPLGRGQDFRTGCRKLAQIWTSHIVAASNEGSSRNTPAAWLLGGSKSQPQGP